MEDAEFISHVIASITRPDRQTAAALVERFFTELSGQSNIIHSQSYRMARGEGNFNIAELTTALAALRRSMPTAEMLVEDRRQASSYATWLTQSTAKLDSGVTSTPDYLTSQLSMVRDLVTQGTFTSMQLDRESMTVVTPPVIIRHNNEDYAMGIYTIRMAVNVPVRLGDVHGSILLSCDTSKNGYIHPHLAREGGCLGNGLMPLSRALINRAWPDALLLVNQLLHAYNAGSPLCDIERWSSHTRCQECNSRLRPTDELVTMDDQQYHRRCTAVISNSDARFRLSAVGSCAMCGRVQMSRDVSGRNGCVACSAALRRERELAASGSAVCHNCETVYDSDHLDQIIDIGRGDRVCRACASYQNGILTFVAGASRRWNAAEVSQLSGAHDGSSSILRPGVTRTTTRDTPRVTAPTYLVCSCGQRQVSSSVSECRAFSNKTRCLACDPDQLLLCKEAQDNPATCLSLVTTWLNTHVHSRIIDFFDLIHPAAVSAETLKQSVRNVILYSTNRMRVEQPREGSVKHVIDYVNTVLGYPAILAPNELIGIYDATYSRAHAVA